MRHVSRTNETTLSNCAWPPGERKKLEKERKEREKQGRKREGEGESEKERDGRKETAPIPGAGLHTALCAHVVRRGRLVVLTIPIPEGLGSTHSAPRAPRVTEPFDGTSRDRPHQRRAGSRTPHRVRRCQFPSPKDCGSHGAPRAPQLTDCALPRPTHRPSPHNPTALPPQGPYSAPHTPRLTARSMVPLLTTPLAGELVEKGVHAACALRVTTEPIGVNKRLLHTS